MYLLGAMIWFLAGYPMAQAIKTLLLRKTQED